MIMFFNMHTMRYKIFCVLLLFLCLQLIDKGNGQVFELTEQSFDQYTRDKDIMLVEFIMPWCHHCQALQPEWEKAAQVLAANREYVLGKVNCWESGKSLCDKLKIEMYPDIRLYRHGVFIESFEGDRNAGAILDFIQRAQSTPGRVGDSQPSAQLQSPPAPAPPPAPPPPLPQPPVDMPPQVEAKPEVPLYQSPIPPPPMLQYQQFPVPQTTQNTQSPPAPSIQYPRPQPLLPTAPKSPTAEQYFPPPVQQTYSPNGNNDFWSDFDKSSEYFQQIYSSYPTQQQQQQQEQQMSQQQHQMLQQQQQQQQVPQQLQPHQQYVPPPQSELQQQPPQQYLPPVILPPTPQKQAPTMVHELHLGVIQLPQQDQSTSQQNQIPLQSGNFNEALNYYNYLPYSQWQQPASAQQSVDYFTPKQKPQKAYSSAPSMWKYMQQTQKQIPYINSELGTGLFQKLYPPPPKPVPAKAGFVQQAVAQQAAIKYPKPIIQDYSSYKYQKALVQEYSPFLSLRPIKTVDMPPFGPMYGNQFKKAGTPNPRGYFKPRAILHHPIVGYKPRGRYQHALYQPYAKFLAVVARSNRKGIVDRFAGIPPFLRPSNYKYLKQRKLIANYMKKSLVRPHFANRLVRPHFANRRRIYNYKKYGPFNPNQPRYPQRKGGFGINQKKLYEKSNSHAIPISRERAIQIAKLRARTHHTFRKPINHNQINRPMFYNIPTRKHFLNSPSLFNKLDLQLEEPQTDRALIRTKVQRPDTSLHNIAHQTPYTSQLPQSQNERTLFMKPQLLTGDEIFFSDLSNPYSSAGPHVHEEPPNFSDMLSKQNAERVHQQNLARFFNAEKALHPLLGNSRLNPRPTPAIFAKKSDTASQQNIQSQSLVGIWDKLFKYYTHKQHNPRGILSQNPLDRPVKAEVKSKAKQLLFVENYLESKLNRDQNENNRPGYVEIAPFQPHHSTAVIGPIKTQTVFTETPSTPEQQEIKIDDNSRQNNFNGISETSANVFPNDYHQVPTLASPHEIQSEPPQLDKTTANNEIKNEFILKSISKHAEPWDKRAKVTFHLAKKSKIPEAPQKVVGIFGSLRKKKRRSQESEDFNFDSIRVANFDKHINHKKTRSIPIHQGTFAGTNKVISDHNFST